MKKWQLEGLCYRVAPRNLVLPDSNQTEVFRSRSASFSILQQEPKLLSWCRKVAAFFIRFF